jgi:GLPGLI family protein
MCQNLSVSYSRINNNEERIEEIEKKYKHLKEDIRAELIQMFNIPMNFSLRHYNGQSKFQMEESVEGTSEKELNFSNHSIRVVHQKSKMDPHVFKDILEGETLEMRDAMGKGFIVKDSLAFDWEITQEKKYIGEYECTKAKTFYDDMEVEAWFAEAIPVYDGPGVFFGLPGLILEVKTETYYYGALEIAFPKESEIIERPSGYPMMVREEFDVMFKKRIENMFPEGSSVKLYK